jgi:hypothetical protein
VALEGTRGLGFRLIGRRPDQPGSLRARYSPGAILDDVFENGEDRSLAVALEYTAVRAIRVLFVSPSLSFATGRADEDYRGAYRSADRFLAVGAADMSQKKKGAIRRAQVVATTEGVGGTGGDLDVT